MIVPVYRVEEYLDRCVQSVLAQTFADFELILIDDGSPDRCPAMCDSWAERDSRIRVLHKENGGLSSARNAGLEICRGSYVCFADSDDWLEPNMLEYLYRLLQEHPEAQIAQCRELVSRGQGEPLTQPTEEIRVLDKKQMLDSFFRIHGEPSNNGVWNKLFTREVLEGFSFVITLNEDVEASFDFCQRAEHMVVSNQYLYHYFVNQSGITRSSFCHKDLDYLAVWDRILGRTAAECPEYVRYAEIGRKRANFTMLVKMMTKGYDRGNQELCAVKKELKAHVRSDFGTLMRWKMPVSRKILLVLVCL